MCVFIAVLRLLTCAKVLSPLFCLYLYPSHRFVKELYVDAELCRDPKHARLCVSSTAVGTTFFCAPPKQTQARKHAVNNADTSLVCGAQHLSPTYNFALALPQIFRPSVEPFRLHLNTCCFFSQLLHEAYPDPRRSFLFSGHRYVYRATTAGFLGEELKCDDQSINQPIESVKSIKHVYFPPRANRRSGVALEETPRKKESPIADNFLV